MWLNGARDSAWLGGERRNEAVERGLWVRVEANWSSWSRANKRTGSQTEQSFGPSQQYQHLQTGFYFIKLFPHMFFLFFFFFSVSSAVDAYS